jgi:hypothetical protein
MPCPQKDLSIQYVTSVSPSMTKLAMLPTSCPSTVIARMVTSGDVLTFAMWTSNAVAGILGSAGGHPDRLRIPPLFEQGIEVGVVNRPQRHLSHKRPQTWSSTDRRG